MIEVLLTNGDCAEAETPQCAVFAALTLIEEARDAAPGFPAPKASFYVDGKCVMYELGEVYLRSQVTDVIGSL